MNNKTLKQLIEELGSNSLGLSHSEALSRLEKYGHNKITAKKPTNWFFEFFKEFKDLMVIILIIASIIAYFFGEKTDGTVIMFIVFLNAFIGFIQKYKAEKAIEALKKMVAPHAIVLREGETVRIDAKEVVPGDIIIVNEGDAVPADARLIEANNLSAREAVLSGESNPVIKVVHEVTKPILSKFQKINNLYMGTEIAAGNGKALVYATNMQTEFGKIAHLTATTQKDLSPLQKELFKIGIFVGKITLTISALLVLIGIFLQGQEFIDAILFAVSVAVAAVPEGLPATITIALALGVQRLAKQNAIVKELSSAETLGATTVICSDKTGTLTKNEMTVEQVVTLDNQIHISGTGYKPEGHLSFATKKNTIILDNNLKKTTKTKFNLEKLKQNSPKLFEQLEIICHTVLLANNAHLSREDEMYKIIGDPTEGSLIVFSEKAGHKHSNIKSKYERIKEFPFDSVRKMMSTVDKEKKTKKIIIHSKGAPEKLLEKCTHIIYKGKVVKITPTLKKTVLQHNQFMARQSLRVLGLAYKKCRACKEYKKENVESGLTFIGLTGMIDPPRPEVKKAVQLTKQAGIRTYIITGDFSLTAIAVAKKLKLFEYITEENVITGEKLDKISMKELEKMLRQKNTDYLFARVSPEHKLKIVSALKNNGEIVAVTGDGVNDAPALKRSDIGISMGIAGTDVSKAAANLVLADDSYATIVTAVKEGRTIYDNIKKFIYYIFSCNIGELITVFAAIIMRIPMPLTAVLILAVDIGTDILPALALGFDPSEPDIMHKKPRPVKSKILSRWFIVNFFITGIYIGFAVLLGYFYIVHYRDGWTYLGGGLNTIKGTTFAFALLVIIQMFHSFNSRSLSNSIFKLGFFSNKHLLGAIAISVLFTYAVTEVGFLQKYLKTTSLDPENWIVIVVLASSIIIVDEIKKIFIRKYQNVGAKS